jgi:heterodisulfide reductase subunit D
MDIPPLDLAMKTRTAQVLERCVACGACAEVCPMPAPAGIDASNPSKLTEGILTILRGGEHAEAARWASVCSGSGHCIPKCQYGVDPRFMLTMARLEMASRNPDNARRKNGFAGFGSMTVGVRVLSRLQLPPDLLARFRPENEPDRPPEVVFYTGCNLMKTPHIALLCLDILDAMDVPYRVMGGPSSCCGVLQFRAGDLTTSGRIAYRTIDRLKEAAPRAITWCPTCQIQLGEVVAPGMSDDPFDLKPIVLFLAERLDDLRQLMVHPVNKRVGLHEHPGVAGVTESAQSILRAIPGLDFVDLQQTRLGYQCNTLSAVPAFKREAHRQQLEAAEEAGVTTLAGVYHACRRELCSHERDWPFEVVNFLELVGESMGLTRPDLFKRMKLMQDIDAILAEAAPMIETHHLDLDEARAIIAKDMLGEQPLPLGRGNALQSD